MNIFYSIAAIVLFAFISYQITDGREARRKKRIERYYRNYKSEAKK